METLTVKLTCRVATVLTDITESINKKAAEGYSLVTIYADGVWLSPSADARKNPPNIFKVELMFQKKA